MASPLIGDDIQENICVLLEDYPFFKVFSQPTDFNIFSDDNFDIICKFSGMMFKINIADGRTVSASPYLIFDNKQRPPTEDTRQKANAIKILYVAHKPIIEGYIKTQLINSGILGVLPNIPITGGHKNVDYELYDPVTNAFMGRVDSPEFETTIFVRLNPRRTPIGNTEYHNDSNLFQILQYYNQKLPYVLGSELLFYHENDTNIHRHLKTIDSDTGESFFPRDIMGDLVFEKHNLVKKIYQNIKAAGLSPPLLRNKLHNGDTVVFPDTLWKHAVIDPNENREDNIMHIRVADTGQSSKAVDVTVCAERIHTGINDYENRRIVGLFCGLTNTNYLNPEYFLDPFSLIDEGVKSNITTVNFNEEQCSDFLTQLSRGDGCITIPINGTTPNINIKHRGGLNIKPRNKKNSKKTLKRAKKSKKEQKRHSKRVKTYKTYKTYKIPV